MGSGSGVVSGSYYNYSDRNVTWVISLTTLNYSRASIHMTYWIYFEDSAAVSRMSPT